MNNEKIDGFLVFPQHVATTTTHVKIGVSIVPSRVRGIFSFELIEKMRQSFEKVSNIFVDSKEDVAHISRVVSSHHIPNDIRLLKAELHAIGIHVMETPLPREKDVDYVLAS